ncbi:MAG: ABC transporter ATP-binding protein [Micrococcaceae bacterium]|nr:ABC transporter ATP-binding protein [Micrococcaceae bacterium]
MPRDRWSESLMTHSVSTPAVACRNVGRAFGTNGSTRQILTGVNLEIGAAEIISIIGASGSGKSTLLRALGGLDTGFTGKVLIENTEVNEYDARCAVGFQEPRLLPWATVADNVAIGLPDGLSKAEGRARVAELLELVGLTDAAEHRPRKISGGMAQRASLARAMARDPEILLLDEPFGALDALTRIKMQQLLLDVHAQTGTTTVMVTHDVDEALLLSDRIVLLDDSPHTQGATIANIFTPPVPRPRVSHDPALVSLRKQLLTGLGVETLATSEV